MNIIPYQVWQTLKQEKAKCECKPATSVSKLHVYSQNEALDIKGVFAAKVTLATRVQLPDEFEIIAFKGI
jgi:hypothetical protein